MKARLDSVCEIIMGQAPAGDEYNDKGEGLPLLAGAGDFKNGRPVAKKFTRVVTKECLAGDLVIGIRASIGDKVIADRPYCLGRGVAVIRPKTKNMVSRYLWHWMEAVRPELERKAKGATFKQVNRADIGELVVALPEPEEQQRIAAILDQAEELRAKRRAAIALLDQLPQAIFLEMFGDPATNPMGWPIKPFSELGRNEDSKRRPIKSSDRATRQGPFPYYGASGIIDSFDDFIFDGARLLIGEDGANLIARSSPIAFIATGRYWVNNHAHVIAEADSASLEFLEQFILGIDLKPYVSGSAQPKLTRSSLDGIAVPTPPIELQRQFSAGIKAINHTREVHQSALAELDTLFVSLQSTSFAGVST